MRSQWEKIPWEHFLGFFTHRRIFLVCCVLIVYPALLWCFLGLLSSPFSSFIWSSLSTSTRVGCLVQKVGKRGAWGAQSIKRPKLSVLSFDSGPGISQGSWDRALQVRLRATWETACIFSPSAPSPLPFSLSKINTWSLKGGGEAGKRAIKVTKT